MKRGEKQEQLVLISLAVIGLIQMAIRPRKTYQLLVHKIGWYESNDHAPIS